MVIASPAGKMVPRGAVKADITLSLGQTRASCSTTGERERERDGERAGERAEEVRARERGGEGKDEEWDRES